MITEGLNIQPFKVTVGAVNGAIYEEVATTAAQHQINIGAWPNLNLTINQVGEIDGGIIM